MEIHDLRFGWETPLGQIQPVRKLGRGKSGHSFLGTLNGGRPVVLKVMHDEPCPHYDFTDDKVSLELRDHEILRDAGVPLPQLLTWDHAGRYLVKSFVDGPTASEWLIAGGDDETVFRQLFALSDRLRRRGLNLDWFPANFAIASGQRLVYIDYEVHPYDEAWSLESWGAYYWANPTGLAAHLATGDGAAINLDAATGQPIRDPFRGQVADWIARYAP